MSPSWFHGLRSRIEHSFESWGHFVTRRPWSVLLASLALAAALSAGVSRIRIDTSTESFLRGDDPIRHTYEEFRQQFGQDGMMVIGVRTADIFQLDFLERLRRFHQDLESELPYLEDIDSLINARETRGEKDELFVEELFDDWPESPEELAAIRQRALANPLYENFLFSREGRFTVLLVRLQSFSSLGEDEALRGFEETQPQGKMRHWLTGEETRQAVEAYERIAAQHERPDFQIFAGGEPLLLTKLQDEMQRDMQRFVIASLLTIALLLWVLFRRPSGVLLPLGVLVLTLLSTMGAMGWSGTPLTLPTQILPSFVMATGIGAAVHVMSIYYQARARGLDVAAGLVHTLGHSGLAIAMTSLTTAGGLISFVGVDMAPIADFGIFAPLGAVLILIYSLSFLPAAIALAPIRTRGRRAAATPIFDRALLACGDFSARRPWTMVGVASLLAIASAVGISKLHVSHDPMSWFPPDYPFRVSNEMIDSELQGSMAAEILIRAPQENGLHDPELLKSLEELRVYAESLDSHGIRVGKANSVSVVVKEINQALNENRPEFYRIPDDRELIAQELLLFENTGTDDLEQIVDPSFQTARFTVRIPWRNATYYPPFLAEMKQHFVQELGDRAEVTLTGVVAVMSRTVDAVINTLIRSYIVGFLIITPQMILMIGSLRGGLLSMVPNLLPVILTLGLMGAIGLPIDLFTLLTGCIAMGLAVDDTIHFMHNFQGFFRAHGDARRAIRETMETTGRAILFTAIVLCSGFFIFMLSPMTNVRNFGLVSGFCIAAAFVVEVMLTPALLVLVRGRTERQREPVLVEGASS